MEALQADFQRIVAGPHERSRPATGLRCAGERRVRGRLFVCCSSPCRNTGCRDGIRRTRVRTPWFKNLLIRVFLKLFDVDMSEAVEIDPYRYGSFNDFFTRALRPEARPIAAAAAAIASPVDGMVSECGAIDRDELLQAKGRRYTLAELLADEPWAPRFEGGSFATIYLAPFNYHRIHMPMRGRLLDTVYVPGRLFSVNATTAQHVRAPVCAQRTGADAVRGSSSGNSHWCWWARSTSAAWPPSGPAISLRPRDAP